MKNKNKLLWSSLSLLITFIIFTILVKFIDIQNIGPKNSPVGLATINYFFHNLIGVNFILYHITDWASILPIIFSLSFAIIGLTQWIKRKKLSKVDKNIIALGILYIATFVIYVIFEFVVINRRPVLIEGILEASYPSSTTILSIIFLLSFIKQISIYIKNTKLNTVLKSICITYSLFLVIGRIISGVHWITDIFAGVLISASLLLMYYGLLNLFNNEQKK